MGFGYREGRGEGEEKGTVFLSIIIIFIMVKKFNGFTVIKNNF